MNQYLSLKERCNQTKVFGVLDEPVGAEQRNSYNPPVKVF